MKGHWRRCALLLLLWPSLVAAGETRPSFCDLGCLALLRRGFVSGCHAEPVREACSSSTAAVAAAIRSRVDGLAHSSPLVRKLWHSELEALLAALWSEPSADLAQAELEASVKRLLSEARSAGGSSLHCGAAAASPLEIVQGVRGGSLLPGTAVTVRGTVSALLPDSEGLRLSHVGEAPEELVVLGHVRGVAPGDGVLARGHVEAGQLRLRELATCDHGASALDLAGSWTDFEGWDTLEHTQNSSAIEVGPESAFAPAPRFLQAESDVVTTTVHGGYVMVQGKVGFTTASFKDETVEHNAFKLGLARISAIPVSEIRVQFRPLSVRRLSSMSGQSTLMLGQYGIICPTPESGQQVMQRMQTVGSLTMGQVLNVAMREVGVPSSLTVIQHVVSDILVPMHIPPGGTIEVCKEGLGKLDESKTYCVRRGKQHPEGYVQLSHTCCIVCSEYDQYSANPEGKCHKCGGLTVVNGAGTGCAVAVGPLMGIIFGVAIGSICLCGCWLGRTPLIPPMWLWIADCWSRRKERKSGANEERGRWKEKFRPFYIWSDGSPQRPYGHWALKHPCNRERGSHSPKGGGNVALQPAAKMDDRSLEDIMDTAPGKPVTTPDKMSMANQAQVVGAPLTSYQDEIEVVEEVDDDDEPFLERGATEEVDDYEGEPEESVSRSFSRDGSEFEADLNEDERLPPTTLNQRFLNT